MLLNGHQLMRHLDGSNPVPPMPLARDNLTNLEPIYQIWFSHDQLIQQAMMASVDPTITQIVATTPTSQTVWELLHMAYANKSHTRFFSL